MGYDTVIVGAGVMGSAIALRLAQAGQRVLVLEKSIPGAEASSAAAGILGPQIEADREGPGFRLGLASREAWGPFAAEVEGLSGVALGHARSGVLELALPGDDLSGVEKRLSWQRAAGLAVEKLTSAEVRRLEPAIAGEVMGGLHLPAEGRVDAQAVARALPIAAERAGASFRRATVRGVRTADGRAAGVELEGDRVEADAVVVAAGAWTPLVEGVGLPADAVRPIRGQVVKLAVRAPPFSNVLFTPRGYLEPRASGEIVCGSTMESVGFDKRVTAAGIAGILANAIAAVPGLAQAELAATWAGFRPYPKDGTPLVGPTATPGLFVASGHHRNGILLTPETARLVATAVLGKPDPLLAAFSPARF